MGGEGISHPGYDEPYRGPCDDAGIDEDHGWIGRKCKGSFRYAFFGIDERDGGCGGIGRGDGGDAHIGDTGAEPGKSLRRGFLDHHSRCRRRSAPRVECLAAAATDDRIVASLDAGVLYPVNLPECTLSTEFQQLVDNASRLQHAGEDRLNDLFRASRYQNERLSDGERLQLLIHLREGVGTLHVSQRTYEYF